MKKLLALILALVMVFGIVACGNTETPTEPNNGGNNSSDNGEANKPDDNKLEPVTLKMWMHGSNVSPDASKKVMAELNAYLQEKINVTLEPIWGTWGDFDTATVTALTGGEPI